MISIEAHHMSGVRKFLAKHEYVAVTTRRRDGTIRRRFKWKPLNPVADSIRTAMDAIAAAGHQGGVEWKVLEKEYKRFSQNH